MTRSSPFCDCCKRRLGAHFTQRDAGSVIDKYGSMGQLLQRVGDLSGVVLQSDPVRNLCESTRAAEQTCVVTGFA